MDAAAALDVLRLLQRSDVVAWVDGGWGVDALLGRQTRPHVDVDVVVPETSVPAARAALAAAGFTVLRDWLPTALAVRHPDGREVDLHPVVLTGDGGGDQLLPAPDPPFHYGAPVTGSIGGAQVVCVDPETQLRAHVGYEPQPEDRADVAALAARFGLPLPPGFAAEPPAPPAGAGELVTEELPGSGGRLVSVFLPSQPPELLVVAGDGQLVAPWGGDLAAAEAPPAAVLGLHRDDDEDVRLREYVLGLDDQRFAAHEQLLVGRAREWARTRFGLSAPAERTAACGVSAGGELALALGLRHPDVFGVVLAASPGGGYRPPAPLPRPLARTYLVAGTGEPWFFENAARWADALRAAGADVVLAERAGEHGGPFWRAELPLAVRWALDR